MGIRSKSARREILMAIGIVLSGWSTIQAANISWSWDASKETRSCAASADATLASAFASASEAPAWSSLALSAFDSRLWMFEVVDVDWFSTLPPGGAVIVR